MNQDAILIMNNSNECINAVKILSAKKIDFTPVFVEKNELSTPTLIIQGIPYRGMEGIKVYIGSGKELVKNKFESE